MYLSKDLKRLQTLSGYLKYLAMIGQYLFSLIFIALAVFIFTVPTISQGPGGYELNSMLLKALPSKGLTLEVKAVVILMCILWSWLNYKIFDAAKKLFSRWALAEVFEDENTQLIFKIVKYYFLLLLSIVVVPSLVSILAGFPVLAAFSSSLIKFPWAHVGIVACIYLVGLMLKLAIENKKDLEGTY